MLRYSIILILIFISCRSNDSQAKVILNSQEKKVLVNDTISIDRRNFEEVVYEVIKLYNLKQLKINKLIHPEKGIYMIVRYGTIDARFKKNKICFTNCSEEDNLGSPHSQIIKNQILDSTYTIKYEFYPNFPFEDCESATKEGLFVDTLATDRLLSNTIKNYKNVFLEEELDISYAELDKEVEQVMNLENNSRKVMLTKNDGRFYGGHFIFYLTKIDNQWWLTTIDFVTMDCSV